LVGEPGSVYRWEHGGPRYTDFYEQGFELQPLVCDDTTGWRVRFAVEDAAGAAARAATPGGKSLPVSISCARSPPTRSPARGFILPPQSQIGNPAEDTLLPSTAAELQALGIKLREAMVDGGFNTTPTNTALEGLADTVHITGRQEQGSRRTRRH
jgi:hypothetical protein